MNRLLTIFLLCFTLAANQPIHAQIYQAESAHARIQKSQLIRLQSETGEIDFVQMGPEAGIRTKDQKKWLKESLKAEKNHDFSLLRQQNDQNGYVHFRYQQTYKGIKIEGAHYKVHSLRNEVLSANGSFHRVKNLDISPKINASAALDNAKKHSGAFTFAWEKSEQPFPEAELVILPINDTYKLAYKFDIYALEPFSRHYYFIDATNGSVLDTYNRIHTNDVEAQAITRYHGQQAIVTDSLGPSQYRLRESGRGGGIQTLNLRNGTSYANAVDFTSSDKLWDDTSNDDDVAYDAHWGTEKTYDYFLDEHGLNSYDGQGSPLLSYIHYDFGVSNAFWNGVAMTYGDGDGQRRTAFTALDIVAHEVTHGVTEFSANLIYRNESGALNESFSDIFGTVIDFYADPGRANYIIGDQIALNGQGIRSMSNPNLFRHPDTYQGSFWETDPNFDFGGVHINSGVQNYWFYLLTNGGSGTNDNGDTYSVEGIGMDKAAEIAFRNLTVYLGPSSNFADARFYAIQSALDLYGACSPEVIATTNAWHAVGLGEVFSNSVVADFSASQTYSCEAPVSIQFSSASINASNYLWDFGDSTTSTLANPSHAYESEGIYSVSLIVSGTSLCSLTDTLIREDYMQITNSGGPLASVCKPFSLNPFANYGILELNLGGIENQTAGATEGYQDFTCEQTASVKVGSIVPFELQFGDGIDQKVRIWIDYDHDGNFNNAEELVYENLQAAGTIEDSILIYANSTLDTLLRMRIGTDINGPNNLETACTSPNRGQFEDYGIIVSANSGIPVANFKSDKELVFPGDEVSFTDFTQNLPSTWRWEFPGGLPAASDQQNPTIKYPIKGIYPVRLFVSNENGADSIEKKGFIVVGDEHLMCLADSSSDVAGVFYDSGGPNGNFLNTGTCTFLINSDCSDKIELFFRAFDLGNFASLSIYDGRSSRAPRLGIFRGTEIPAPVVSSSGALFIVFSSSSSIAPGWEAYWKSDVGEGEGPIADFGISDSLTLLNVPVKFTDRSQNNPVAWFWDFGDGASSEMQSPNHAYEQPGSYEVRLIADNCFGLDTTYRQIQVMEAPRVSWSPEELNFSFEQCDDSVSSQLRLINSGQGDMLVEASALFSVEERSFKEFNFSNRSTRHTFTGLTSNVTFIELAIRLVGDFDRSFEYASLTIDGVDLGIIEDQNSFDYTSIVRIEEDRVREWLMDGQLDIVIQNTFDVDGDGSHTVTLISEEPGWINPLPDQMKIAAGDTGYMDIWVNSLLLNSGTYENDLRITTNDPLQRYILIPVSLTVDSPPVIQLSDSCLDFGEIIRDVRTEKTLIISNPGCDTLRVSLNLPSSQFTIGETSFFILPGQERAIAVQFQPDSIGQFEGILSIANNDRDTTICLKGTGLPSPNIFVDPAALNVDIVGCEDTASVDFYIFNPGESNLNFSIPTIPAQPDTLQVLALTYGTNLQRNYQNILRAIRENGPPIRLTETSNTSPAAIRQLLEEKDVFIISPQNSSSNDEVFSGLASLLEEYVKEGGNVIFFGSRFLRSRELFNSSLFSGRYISSRSGTFNPVLIENPEHPIFDNIDEMTTQTYTCYLDLTNPDVQRLASYRSGTTSYDVISFREIENGKAIYFGYDFDGLSSQSMAAEALGNTMSWLKTEAQIPVINISPNTGTISPGDSAKVNALFYPNGLLAGTYRTSIKILSNDPLVPVLPIKTTINFSGVAELELSAECIEFGTITQGFSRLDSVIISNPGCANLQISRTEITSRNFQLVKAPSQLEPGETAYVVMRFRPLQTGSLESKLRLISQLGVNELCLKGESTPLPQIGFNKERIDVDFSICKDSTKLPLTLYNTGAGPLSYHFDRNQLSLDETSSKIFTRTNPSTEHTFMINDRRPLSLELVITLNGGFRSSFENASLEIEGQDFGIIPDGDLPNGTDIVVPYTFTPAEYLDWLTDGQLEVKITNSSNVFTTSVAKNSHTVQAIIRGNSWFDLRPARGMVQPGDSVELDVLINATQLSVGNFNSEILLNYNHPNSPAKIPLSLRLKDDPILQVSEDCLDFGQVPILSETTREFFIFNQGCKTLVIDNIVADDDIFFVSETSFEIGPNDFRKVEVIVKADEQGVFSQQLFVISNAGSEAICLEGEIAGKAGIAVNPMAISANVSDCDDSQLRNLFIQNTGSADLIIEIDENHPDWLEVNKDNDTIPANENTSIELSFSGQNLDAGNYNGILVLLSNDPESPMVEISLSLTVGSQPCADFFADTEDNCDGEVQFQDLSGNSPSLWLWDFGDGQISSEQHPTHTYASAGIFIVRLIVANENGASSTSQAIIVSPFTGAPCAKFVASPSVSCDGVVNFTDLSGGSPTMWIWDFGDGNISTVQHPTHSYTQAGTYQVKLIVVTSSGVDVAEENIEIGIIQAAIALSGDLAVGSTLTLSSNESGATSWLWDLGDGSVSDQETVEHIYDSAGSYEVELMVSNEAGCTAETKRNLEIEEASSARQASSLVLESENFRLYPNPASDSFKIKYEGKETARTIKLFNLWGQEVYSKELMEKLNSFTYEVKIPANIADGTYFVILQREGTSLKQRLVISRN